jgi:hypothetical protein
VQDRAGQTPAKLPQRFCRSLGTSFVRPGEDFVPLRAAPTGSSHGRRTD